MRLILNSRLDPEAPTDGLCLFNHVAQTGFIH